jgi:hypothetical protein
MNLRAAIMVPVLLVTLCSAHSAANETVAQLEKRLESARREEQPPICLALVWRYIEQSSKAYADGKAEDAGKAIQQAGQFAEQATTAALDSGKHQKRVEIELRKMAHRLRDMNRTLAFEDQPTVQAAVDRIEDLRSRILQHMFAKKK